MEKQIAKMSILKILSTPFLVVLKTFRGTELKSFITKTRLLTKNGLKHSF